MEFKPYLVRSPDDLKRFQQREGIQVISELSPAERGHSTSQWNLRHLVAYRLLVQPTGIIPALSDNHDQCPVCEESRHVLQTVNRDKINALLRENPDELIMKPESELMQMFDGFFWVALARTARPELAELEEKVHPRRARQPPARDGFVNSSSAIPGSSSPVTATTASEFDPNIHHAMDEDEHEARRNKPEDVTVHLVSCFLQYVLNLCLAQHPSGQPVKEEVRVRIERRLLKAQIGTATISAEDDGGICRMRQTGLGWEMRDPYLARLEAKRAFQRIHYNTRTSTQAHIVSNEDLAQCLGEAVIAWKGNQEAFPNGVFLLAATNTFVRLLHFTFGHDYLDYLDAIDAEDQRDIINNQEDTFVYMHSTDWFDLESPAERRSALCQVLALVRWQDAWWQDAQSKAQTNDDDDDDDDDDSDDVMDMDE